MSYTDYSIAEIFEALERLESSSLQDRKDQLTAELKKRINSGNETVSDLRKALQNEHSQKFPELRSKIEFQILDQIKKEDNGENESKKYIKRRFKFDYIVFLRRSIALLMLSFLGMGIIGSNFGLTGYGIDAAYLLGYYLSISIIIIPLSAFVALILRLIYKFIFRNSSLGFFKFWFFSLFLIDVLLFMVSAFIIQPSLP
jgi:hypothetical protein